MSTESIHFADGVEFVPLGTLDDGGDGGTTVDYARSKGRWAALPEGWLNAKDMRETLMRIARVPEYDWAAGEALVLAMGDFLEIRGSGRTLEYRRVAEAPEPMSPAAIVEAETTRLAELERERFERELQAREAKHAAETQVYLDNNRRLWNELAGETVTPQIEALERRLAQLEGQLAQHGELEAVGAASTPTSTPAPIEAPAAAESKLAQARRWMFGDAEDSDIERLLEQDEDE